MPIPIIIAIAHATVETSYWIYASYTGMGALVGAGTLYSGFKLQEYWRQNTENSDIHINQNCEMQHLSESVINGLQKIDTNVQNLLLSIQKTIPFTEETVPHEIKFKLELTLKVIADIQNSFQDLKTLTIEANKLNHHLIERITILNQFLKTKDMNILFKENQKLISQNKILHQQNQNKDLLIKNLFNIINKNELSIDKPLHSIT